MKSEYTDQNRLRNLYQQFGSGVQVAAYLNVPYKVLARYLKKYGITNRITQKRNIDNYFQQIDTEDKAYFLGFFYADGYTSIKTSENGFQINLQEQDRVILEQFSLYAHSTYPIRISDVKYQNGTSKQCRLSIYNRAFVNSLISQGCVPGKINRVFPNLQDTLVRHFLRGYFDADGTFSTSHIERHNPVPNIGYCGNISFMEQVLQVFEAHEIFLHMYYNQRHKTDFVSISASSREMVHRRYSFFYTDATVFLQRKKEKIEQYIQNCPLTV